MTAVEMKEAIERLSVEGLKSCTSEQLDLVSTGLRLNSIAERVALTVLSDAEQEHIEAIRINAPLRALDQAVRNFVPNGKPYSLSSYLKRYTWFWAKRYAEDIAKGKQVPVVHLPTTCTATPADTATDLEPDTIAERPRPALLSHFETVLQEAGIGYTAEQSALNVKLWCNGLLSSARIIATDKTASLFIVSPVLVPEYRRPAVAEAITRLNWLVPYPTFEMDFSDGEIRVRNAFVHDDSLPPTAASYIFHATWADMYNYGLALVELAVTDNSPEIVIERARASAAERERNHE